MDNLVLEEWNKNSYRDFINYLFQIQDLKYRDFHKSLVLNSKYELIGIRVPVLRKIALEISKGDYSSFFNNICNKYYEEIMIQGFIISRIKNEEEFYKYFKNYINSIDNWALCDSFCASLKIVRKYESKYFNIAKDLSLSNEEFISRIGLIMILNHFINKDNLNDIYLILNKIKSDKFYINMAEAWLVCELYIKFPKETKKFISKNNLNRFTQNKAISKINDSYRINEEEKKSLKEYRK